MVCTANTCRSPMAELLMRDALLDRKIKGIEVTSAGVAAHSGMPAMYEAIETMDEYHLDLRYHVSKPLAAVYQADSLILCMTRSHLMAVKYAYPQANAHLLMEYAGLPGEVSDPFALGLTSYRRAAGDMWRAVNAIADKLAQEMK